MLLMVMMAPLTNVHCQSKSADDRAKLMHRAITTNDSEFVKTFVEENYSKRLLEKYDIQKHTGMLNQLRREFKDSKIVSIKEQEDNKLLMVIERISDKHKVMFELFYSPKDENKIDGVGIEAGEL